MSPARYAMTLTAYLLLLGFMETGSRNLAGASCVILGVLIGVGLFDFCRWAARLLTGERP